MSGGRIECREEDGGFRLLDETGREYATFSRGSNAIDVNPMSLDVAKDCLFAIGAELLRIDERAPADGPAPVEGVDQWVVWHSGHRTPFSTLAEAEAFRQGLPLSEVDTTIYREVVPAPQNDCQFPACEDGTAPCSKHTLVLRPLEEFIPELLELARGEDHDKSDCPQDDTCRCANIAALNAELKSIQRMRAKS